MKCIVQLAFVVLLMLAVIRSALAISCYSCNSHEHPDCGENPTKYKQDCRELKDGTKYDRCRKIDQWVDFDIGDLKSNKRVIRACGWNQTDERPCYYRAGFGGRQLVCTCHKDDCNSASQLGLTATLTLASTAVLLVIKAAVF